MRKASKRTRIAAGSVLLVVGLLAAGLWLAARLAPIGRDLCSYTPREEKVSPDGRLKAAVVEVDCGATTDYAAWAVVAEARRPYAFKTDRVASIEGRAMTIAWEGQRLVIFWRSERPPNRGPGKQAAVELRPL